MLAICLQVIYLSSSITLDVNTYQLLYRVCQGLWPSLMFANKNIEPKIFWASSKSQAATTYACIFVVITLVGPTKVSIMKLKCTKLNRMWQHDFMTKQIFFSSVFLSKNTGRLAKQAGYLGPNPWHTRQTYVLQHCFMLKTTHKSKHMIDLEYTFIN